MNVNMAVELVAFASIVASSIYYTVIWYAPEVYKKAVAPEDPCMHMAKWANVLKVVQFASVLGAVNWVAAVALPAWQWAAALALIAVGQHLNFLVYKLLGINGVYYGSRFGKKLEWVTAYPYNTVRDPQYIGSMITLLGCAFVAPTEIMVWWFANYCYLMWLESKVPDVVKVAL